MGKMYNYTNGLGCPGPYGTIELRVTKHPQALTRDELKVDMLVKLIYEHLSVSRLAKIISLGDVTFTVSYRDMNLTSDLYYTDYGAAPYNHKNPARWNPTNRIEPA